MNEEIFGFHPTKKPNITKSYGNMRSKNYIISIEFINFIFESSRLGWLTLSATRPEIDCKPKIMAQLTTEQRLFIATIIYSDTE